MLNKMVPFLLLPLLTSYLSPAEYGIIALIQVFMSFYQSFFGVLDSHIPRKYFRLSPQQFGMFMSAIVVVLCCIFLLSCLIAFTHVFTGASLFGLDQKWYLVMPVVACMSMANLLNLGLLRTREKPFQYAAWEVSHTILNLLLSLVLVMNLHAGWEGRAIGITAPVILYGCLGLYAMLRQQVFSSDWSWLDVKEISCMSASLVPHALAAVTITLIDRLFIGEMLGESFVGIYAVGYQFGMVVMLFTESFLKAWQPWFFKKLAVDCLSNKLSVVRNTRFYIYSLVVGATLYAVFAKWLLPFVVNIRFHAAGDIIFPVVVGYMFYGIYQIMFSYLVHTNKMFVLGVITPLAAAVNIVLNIIWIPIYGIAGAAYATIAAYAVSSVLVFLYSNKHFPMPWLASAK